MKARIALLALLIAVSPVFAQKKKTAAKTAPAAKASTVVSSSATLNDVKLFQSFFEDAPVIKTNYVHPAFSYSSYENMSAINIGAMGGHPISPKLDVEAELYYSSLSYDIKGADGQSGITDLGLHGKYNLKSERDQVASVGAYISLPIGSEDIGQGNLNFGGFGAYRKALSGGMVVTANAGLYFYEVPKTTGFDADDFDFRVGLAKAAKVEASGDAETEHETRLRLGAGLIYPMSGKKTNLVGEIVLLTKVDYMMLSGGVDHTLSNGAKLRGGLGIGLDDGAPDLMIMAGYFMKL
jgi:hypothetical protein